MAGTRRIPAPLASREFVDRLLADLRSSGFSFAGWGRLWRRSLERSEEQAARHPRAEREAHLLHVLAAPWLPARWTIASWWMTWSHLGLLGEDDRPLGWPNRLTLLRAILPALLPGAGPVPALLAIGTDFADGRLARASDGATAFGAFADPLADSIFWTWFALREEPNQWLRALSVALWVGPAAGVTAAYFVRAEATGIPDQLTLRPISAALQVLLTARSVGRRLRKN